MTAPPTLGILLGLALGVTPPPPETPPPDTQPTVPVFGVESSVVLLDVIARDKKGHLVRDLTPSDFEVYEDGERQVVTSFRVIDNTVELAGGRTAEGATAATTPRATSVAPEAASTSPTASSTSPSVIAFLYDRLTTEGRDTAHRAALAYAARAHVDGDMVGVFQLDLALHTLQPFTTDIHAIEGAFERANLHAQTPFAHTRQEQRAFFDRAAAIEQALATVTGTTDAAKRANADSLTVQRRFALLQGGVLQSFDRLERDQQGFSSVNGLLALVGGLNALPGRKTIVFFSEGVNLTSNVVAHFRSVIATANRANVTVYAVDVGGLRAISTTREARDDLVATSSQRLNDEARGSVDPWRGALTRGQERAEDMLRQNPQVGLGQLAEETGGFLVTDTNDAARGFRRIQEETHFYYLLSYSPTDQSFDGRYRAIALKVARPGLEIHSRKGYLALKSNTSVPVRTFEAPGLAILGRSPLPDDFPLAVAALSFPETQRPGRVPVFVQFPGSVLSYTLDKKSKVYTARFTVVARLRDAAGYEVDRMSRDYPLSVPADKLEAARRGNVLYLQEADLRPGRYTLEAVAWDANSRKASARTAMVEVPAAAADDLRLSSLVLLQKVERLSAAEQARDNPLHYGEAIVYPNLGAPYQRSETPNLGFFFTVYGDPGYAPHQAVVELFRGDTVTARLPLQLPAPDEKGRIQQAGTLPIQALAPGDYGLRITVATGARFASRLARFVVAD